MALTDEQLARRRTGICASDMAPLAGLSERRKPIDVFQDKRGLLEPSPENQFSHWGQRHERTIAEEYLERHASEGIMLRESDTLERHASKDLIVLATPDRLVYKKRKPMPIRDLECKTADRYMADLWGPEGTDEVPQEYLIQVQTQLYVTQLDEATLAALIGGNDYREYVIRRDDELIGYLLEIAEKFWRDHVMTGIPPPVDGSEQYSTYLKRRFPRDNRPMLPLTEEARDYTTLLRAARDEMDRKEADVMTWSNRLKAIIGDAGGIEGLCTWKANRPSVVVDWEKAFRSLSKVRLADGTIFKYSPDLAEAVQRFTTTKPGARPFKLINPKEK